MEMLGLIIGILFLIDIVMGMTVSGILGCLGALILLAMLIQGGWAAILFFGIPTLILYYIREKFFPVDENGELIVKPRPCPVVLRRPAKFVLPKFKNDEANLPQEENGAPPEENEPQPPPATDASDEIEPPDDLDDSIG